jgi:hypothetical protein
LGELDGSCNPVTPEPALAANAPTVSCPSEISAALEASDRTQAGRHSRIAPVAACGTAKGNPGTAADPANPHFYDVYRFANPTNAAVCFNFVLSYGGALAGVDAGSDASATGVPDAAADAGAPPVAAGPARYMTAYATFYPTDLTFGPYLGDVGDQLFPPQSLGVTVPAGGTIDVVVYAIDNAPAGAGAYTLSCTTQ